MTGPSADERERVRGYLVGQAQRYDVVDLWPRILGQRLALIGELDGLSEEQARWRPPTGEGEDAWSVLEVTQHIASWTGNVLQVVDAMSAGREVPPMPPVGHLAADPAKTLAEVRRDLVQSSMRLAEFMARPGVDANPDVQVDHALFGPLNLRGWLLFQRIHDVDHLGQVQRLKQMDGFPGDGT